MIGIITSCKKEWLDQKPNKALKVPSSLNDYRTILDNINVFNLSGLSIGEISSDGHSITESVWQTNIQDLERNAYTWSNHFPYLNVNDWNS